MYKLTSTILISFILLGCDSHQHEPVQTGTGNSKASNSPSTSKMKEYYTCSMHTHVKEDKPGKCPICQMNLTKVIVEEDNEFPQDRTNEGDSKVIYHCENFPDVTSEKPDTCPLDGTPMVKKKSGNSASEIIAKVKLRKSQLEHFHPAVFSVTTMKMSKNLRVLGQVKSAEEKLSNIAARFPARVEKVFVESVGSQIRKGDPVVRVYSPELLTAGEELILSAQKANRKNDFSQLYTKAREKLLLWGIRPSQINRWVKAGKVPRNVTLYASSSGVVRKRIAVPGKYFKEGQNYFELSDLSQVWVEMDVYEHDSNLVKLGQYVSLNFVAAPGKPRTGEIDFVSPTIDVKTRTLKVRTTIPNLDGTLKPGMVAQGTVNVTLEGAPLVVPTSAIIDTGRRKVVWLRNKSNKYTAKLVQTGFLSDGYVEILSGIKENDNVVIEGNFLLDAQAQFFGGYEDFNLGDTPANQEHNH